MKNSYHYFITSIFGIILFLAGYAYYDCVTSVEYSLNKLIQSYQVHDTTLFLKHIDLNSLTSNYIDNQSDDTENIFGILYDGESKEDIQDQYKDKIMSWVKDGYSQDPIAKLFLNKYNEYLPKNRSKLVRVITPDQFKDTVTLKLMLYQPRYDTTISLDLTFKKSSMYWQLYDVPNLQETIILLKTLELRQKENVRSFMSDGLLSFIKISNPVIEKDKLKVTLTNKSTHIITNLNCSLFFYDKTQIDKLNLNMINEVDYDDYNIIPIIISKENLDFKPGESITEVNYLNSENPLILPDGKDIGLFISDIDLKSTNKGIVYFRDNYHPITFYGLNHFLL